jgi:hypothetical protein
MLNPDFFKKLMETPEGQKLKEFFLEEADNLNRLDDIKIDDPQALALETKSRQRAYEVVMKMLSTLTADNQFGTMKEKDDSITTEMLERSQPTQET